MNRFKAGAEIASFVGFGEKGARRKAEDNGTNLEEQPLAGGLFAPGKMNIVIQVRMFKRRSRLPIRPCRRLTA